MQPNSVLKGAILVALGAASYGMLATFVKLAYKEHYTTAEVTSAQFVYGILGLLCLVFYQKKNNKKEYLQPSRKNKFQLALAGTSLGLTSVFYYLCVKYMDVTIAIVLLMQTVWMSILVEGVITKEFPSKRKIISVVIVLIGTVLATNVVNSNISLNGMGIFYGLLAAASFTTTMLTANKIAVGVSSARRTLYMLYGGAVVVLIFSLITQTTPFDFSIFNKWGILLALFGTIIPPLLMNAGFPSTGIGLGSIVSSLELPVSVLMAYLILNEKVIFLQWLGIVLILTAIVIMNFRTKKR